MVNLTGIFVSILLVSLFMVGFTTFVNDVNNNYDVNVSQNMSDSLRSFNQSFGELQGLTGNIQNRTSGTTASQTVDSGLSLSNAIKALNLVWDSTGTAGDMLTEFEQRFNIPSYWKWAAIGVLLVALVFIFLSAVLKNPL